MSTTLSKLFTRLKTQGNPEKLGRNLTIIVSYRLDGRLYERVISGRVAQTLYHLITASSRGITVVEVSSWAYRLGAYIHTLRHQYGLNIESYTEPHDGGMHARYVLLDKVDIHQAFRSL